MKGTLFQCVHAKKLIITKSWKAASFFICTDDNIAEKIKHHTNGVMSSDAKALITVRRLEYDHCSDDRIHFFKRLSQETVNVCGYELIALLDNAVKPICLETIEDEKPPRKAGGAVGLPCMAEF
ncbi:hypothetical protein Y032_0398g718 [Ancylostoma ceylanicum]|uniref:Uncharacterized protein n=1 Tax=Ancylostoma ceylanicum TaxID=53326 RepID=A0A016RR10_9BILA|nr:hypothetical protein Y032_0398g718 [Ancylostoma ceylanicum]